MLSTVIAAAAVTACGLAVRQARRAAPADRARSLAARRSRRRLPAVLREPLARHLERADIHATPEDAAALWAATVLALVVVGSSFSPALAVPVGLGGVAAAPVLSSLRRQRAEQARRAELPGLLEDVASELRAGGTIAAFLDRGARFRPRLEADLARVRARARLGLGLSGALERWAREQDDSPTGADVRLVAGALGVAVRAGGRSAGALEGLATSLRDRHAIRAEARALGAQSRLSALVVGALPLAPLLSSAALDRPAFRVLIGTAPGRLALVTGLGCEGLAALWMRRILRVEG